MEVSLNEYKKINIFPQKNAFFVIRDLENFCRLDKTLVQHPDESMKHTAIKIDMRLPLGSGYRGFSTGKILVSGQNFGTSPLLKLAA